MGKIKIMVAEDFQILREDICETINAQDDMEIVGSAASGNEIEDLAFTKDVDLILMDVEMETVTAGIKACEFILEEKPDVKIIFLTSHDSDEMILTSMAAGAVDYIVKGCDEVELIDHIKKALSGSPQLDSKVQNAIMKEYMRLRRSENSLLYFINTVSHLTSTERELIRHLLNGHKVREIANIRCVEIVTVKTQIKTLLKKFNCSRSKEIVKLINELNVGHLF